MNLIVFDVDGTLLNSTSLDDECYQEALKRSFNISMNNFNWNQFLDVTDQGVTEDILQEHFGRPATMEEIKKVEVEMGNLVFEQSLKHPEKFTPAKGVIEFITYLKTEQKPFCLATGAWKKSAESKLSFLSDVLDLETIPWQHASNIRRRADIVLISKEKAKSYYNVEKFDKITAFGDGKWDYLTAKELEIEFIGVNLNNSDKLKPYSEVLVLTEYDKNKFDTIS